MSTNLAQVLQRTQARAAYRIGYFDSAMITLTKHDIRLILTHPARGLLAVRCLIWHARVTCVADTTAAAAAAAASVNPTHEWWVTAGANRLTAFCSRSTGVDECNVS